MWFCPSGENQTSSYDKHWPRLGDSGFYLGYCIQMWRRKLETPAEGMFTHLGARKVFMFDAVIYNPSWSWKPNHLGGINSSAARADRAVKSAGQNQFWTDGSVVWAEGWVTFIAGYSYDFVGSEYFTTERDYNGVWTASGNWWK